jgi:ADP-ribose pyrophosphatase YjhB (NUDIX family)
LALLPSGNLRDLRGMPHASEAYMSASSSSMVIDAVDAANRPTGQIDRAKVFSQKANFRTVHVLIRSLDRKNILLQELPSNHARSPSKLGSSVAGYIHSGESYQHAARRKLREELRINRVRTLTPIDLIEMHDDGVLKFIQIYGMSYNYSGEFDREHIKDVAYYPFKTIDAMVGSEPERFTETFLNVYHRYRQATGRYPTG